MPRSKSYNTYSSLQRPEFRKRVDDLLLKFERDFYEQNKGAEGMLQTESFNLDLYKRHNVETMIRIGLKRAVDPLIANYWATRDPQLCKEWGLYGAEEGRHDRMFAGDLHKVGMTDEEIYSIRPTFATEILNGYFYYTMATEGPLASMISGFYLEYIAGKTQPDWLDVMEQHVGADKTKGARAHLALDDEDDHVDMVWNMIMRVIHTEEDEERFVEHLIKINALFVSYFVEVYAATVLGAGADPSALAQAAPTASLKTNLMTQASMA
ncbi:MULTISPECIES: hypothetical protein [unclassified Solwaraspora]|uniref:hypothetical protein n=1 Tax=unclassified Solwaraspora TaxID=2627926 RepID=UPI00248AEE5C|nr:MULTISPECIES: hypothetical protein [unclassified Solwaraspora]WBB96664.1 hypothetical protein O7553_25770 [Solwaraspora sp. WMMA2059]WBC19432.1 hypothetical protein O7543_21600 [Solwaraspora sp. WMMA2080]WJK32985.1 hypothetical protein O7610_19960 [Solwaraspora sp. WMMA2065]